MAIEDQYLPEDLARVNELLLNLHNISITAIKQAQDGQFDEMEDHQAAISRTIRLLTGYHRRKLAREEFEKNNYLIYSRRGWTHEK